MAIIPQHPPIRTCQRTCGATIGKKTNKSQGAATVGVEKSKEDSTALPQTQLSQLIKSQQSQLMQLPEEPFFNILGMLDPKSLAFFSQSCKANRESSITVAEEALKQFEELKKPASLGR